MAANTSVPPALNNLPIARKRKRNSIGLGIDGLIPSNFDFAPATESKSFHAIAHQIFLAMNSGVLSGTSQEHITIRSGMITELICLKFAAEVCICNRTFMRHERRVCIRNEDF